jgi:glycosyltransferase involved in cell wall biosynthesis
MRILYLAQSFWPTIGGIEVSHRCVLEACVAQGDAVTVLTSPYPGATREHDILAGIDIQRLPFRQALEAGDAAAVALAVARVASVKRAFRPDIVHIAMTDPIGFFHLRTLSAWPSATVVSIHVSIERLAGRTETLLSRLIDTAAVIVVVSQAIADETVERFPNTAERLVVIRPASFAVSRDDAPRTPGPPRLLFAGRMVAEKGAAVLIAALPAILIRHPALELVLAGDGAERTALERTAQELGVARSCRFVGMVPHEEMGGLMSDTDLVVVPSLWKEAFGLVAAEAAALGRAVVASRVGGLPEVVRDGVTGLLTDPGDPRNLAAAILRLLDDPGRLSAMGRAARALAARQFSPEATVTAYRAAHARAMAAAFPTA